MRTRIRIRMDQAPWIRIEVRLCRSQKVGFWHEQLNQLYFINFVKKHNRTYEGTKAILKGWKWCFFLLTLVNFFLAPGSGSSFPIRIWIQERQITANLVPDTNHCQEQWQRKTQPRCFRFLVIETKFLLSLFLFAVLSRKLSSYFTVYTHNLGM